MAGIKIEEKIKAKGHPKITATHRATLMITKDEDIGIEADCVVGVAADKGAVDLEEPIKLAIASGTAVEVTLEVEGMRETIRGWGDDKLPLSNPNDLVVRKSEHTCDRTLMVNADKAAADLSRDFVKRLRNPALEIRILIKV